MFLSSMMRLMIEEHLFDTELQFTKAAEDYWKSSIFVKSSADDHTFCDPIK